MEIFKLQMAVKVIWIYIRHSSVLQQFWLCITVSPYGPNCSVDDIHGRFKWENG